MITTAPTKYVTPDNIDTIFDSLEDPNDLQHTMFKKNIIELQSFAEGDESITLEQAKDYWMMYAQGWDDCKQAKG